MIAPARRSTAGGWNALAIAAIVLVSGWIYGPVLRGTWLWDDGLEIAHNPELVSPGGWWTPWVAPGGMDYLPLKGTLQWVEWRLWGDHEIGYHLVNLALHIAGALLLWRLLGKLGVRHGWVGGLLFAVHPVAVESVAWISEFKNTLALPPLLLAVSAYVDFEADRRRRDYVWALVWFLIAMLGKSSAVMLPVGLLLLTWWRRGRITAADLRASAPFFALALGLGAVTWSFQQHRAIGLSGPMPDFASRLAQAGWSAAAYFREAIFPVGLMPIYPAAHGALPAALPWLGFAALLGLCWAKRRSWGRHALLGLGWFLINLMPVLGFIPLAYLRVAPRADHLAYLPLIGLVGLAAAGLSAVLDAWGNGPGDRLRRGAWLAAGLALIAVCAVSSRSYAAAFRSEEALWTLAVQRNPDSWLAANNLGRVWLEENRAPEAARQLETAVQIGPESAEVRVNLGNAYGRLGRPADARAQYGAALRIDPNFAGAHYDLGRSLLEAGEPAAARDEFRAALRSNPGSAAAHNNLGLALARLGQLSEAMAEYEQALKFNPQLPEAHLNLGNALARQGQLPAAVAQYRAALAADSNYAPAHRNLGSVLAQLGRAAEAQAEFSAAAKPSAPH